MPRLAAVVRAGHPEEAAEAAVVGKAVARAADWLGLGNRELARILGLSEASVSRLRRGAFALDPGSEPFELAVLLVRLFRSLDALVGGDETVARAWLRNPDTALGAVPLQRMATVTGLLDVLAYLDSRRAVL
ncbi:MAG: MbcA/ParS/Xre antitoxin family protein [Dehalococcoidia bacterium]|nr:MbcA/ParS/Xre antitoxin family protein [Geminicoccaceae bacterium]MCS7295886.1 MbcA/ParS/Xre antitoxin family protein [Dehalococcoidia bacterium]MDW8371387.1 DUF2384 domain-containing protein [Geminicoccaceae bacterium]